MQPWDEASSRWRAIRIRMGGLALNRGFSAICENWCASVINSSDSVCVGHFLVLLHGQLGGSLDCDTSRLLSLWIYSPFWICISATFQCQLLLTAQCIPGDKNARTEVSLIRQRCCTVEWALRILIFSYCSDQHTRHTVCWTLNSHKLPLLLTFELVMKVGGPDAFTVSWSR